MGIEIGIREFKNQLSAVIKRVSKGETVTITDRNRPVAVLVPAGALDHVLRQLAKTGRISWSGGKPTGCMNPPKVRGPSASDAVIEDRR